MDKDFEILVNKAKELAHRKRLNAFIKYGHVGAALMTESGNIYTGVAIDCACEIGFCAEHAAIAEMLKHNETRIVKIVAMNSNAPVSPCGRCREMIRMVNPDNMETEVMVDKDTIVKLKDLLPYAWNLDTF